MFLDLSAAFDMVDQMKMLNILHNEIGVTSTALKWFDSFLRGRTQKVKIGDAYSAIMTLDYGVAQGSILGQKLPSQVQCKQLLFPLKVMQMTTSYKSNSI